MRVRAMVGGDKVYVGCRWGEHVGAGMKEEFKLMA